MCCCRKEAEINVLFRGVSHVVTAVTPMEWRKMNYGDQCPFHLVTVKEIYIHKLLFTINN